MDSAGAVVAPASRERAQRRRTAVLEPACRFALRPGAQPPVVFRKTVLMNGVVMELTDRDWPVWISDPKRMEFLGMRGWPNVQVVVTSVQEQVVYVYRAWDEMERWRTCESLALACSARIHRYC